MKVDILNIEGKSTGRSVDLPDDIFGIEPNEHAVYLAVKQYNAHQRQGTHKAKEKGEISASTRKIKKQKGTGTARAGSLKSPLFKGGGRVFGPKPHLYTIKLNKKVKRLARKSALSAKLAQKELVVLEDFTFDKAKTKEFNKVLSNLDIASQKALFVLGDYDQVLYKSASNTKHSSVMNASDINTYCILDAKKVVICESAIEKIKQTFG